MAGPCQCFSSHGNASGIRLFKAQKQSDRRGLAGARFPNQRMRGACGNGERDVVDSRQRLSIHRKGLGHSIDGNLGRIARLCFETAQARVAQGCIAIWIEGRNICMQLAGIGGRGRGEDSLGFTGLLNRAILQHHDFVRPFRGDCQIVGDEQKADVKIVLKLREQIENTLLDGNIESGGRLIRHQKGRAWQDASPISTRCSMPPDSWCG